MFCDIGDPELVSCFDCEIPINQVTRGSNSDQIAMPAFGHGKSMKSEVAHDRCHDSMSHDPVRFNAQGRGNPPMPV